MNSRLKILFGIGLVIALLPPFGSVNALPIKWGNNMVEVNTFSDDLVVSGWQTTDYEHGLKFNSAGARSFWLDYGGDGPAQFQVIRTKQTKRGAITQERWGEVYYNKKGRLKVRWFKGSMGLHLGSLVLPASVESAQDSGPPAVDLAPTEDGEVEADDAGDDLGPMDAPLFTSENYPQPESEPGAAPVPEPATMLLLGAGLIGLAAYGRRMLN